MAASTASASRHRVSERMSAKMGMALHEMTEEAVAMKVYGGTMTSSPAPISMARSDSSSAVVPLVLGTTNLQSLTFLNSSHSASFIAPPTPQMPLSETAVSFAK